MPNEAAADVVADPGHVLRRVLGFIGDPAGTDVANPLGSHGRVATALALLGARVTVFDLSESNARFARELASAAGVEIDYLVGDFERTARRCEKRFDAVVMELGIVHYFIDLSAFVTSVRALMRPGGRVLLNEFHPLLKKAITLGSGQPVVRGDYFAAEVEDAPTPYGTFVDESVPDCLIRRWNLGEIVTAFASGGFTIERLVEHPSPECERLPGTFTLIAGAERG